MKKLLFIIIILHTFPLSILAQFGACRKNQVNPKDFLKEVDSLRDSKNYEKIISILQDKIQQEKEDVLWHFYQLACCYSLKGDTTMAFNYIHKSIELGAPGDDILSDTDFENLYQTAGWAEIKSILVKNYLDKYPKIKNKLLSTDLWLMGIEDQASRSLSANFKKKNTLLNEYEKYKKEHKKRTDFVRALIKKKYWPLYSDGEEACSAALLIVQHSGDNKLFKKALPLIKDAVINEQASSRDYALVYDRYLMRKNKKQVYGTQLFRTCNNIQPDRICTEMAFWPIKDEFNVNARRKEIGLEPIEEAAKQFGIEYIYHPENEKKKIPHRY